MRTACSFASAPPLVKNTRSRSPGVCEAISRAASERAPIAWAGAAVHIVAACSWIALTTRGMLVSQVGEDQLRGEVQQPIVVAIPHVGALSSGQHHGIQVGLCRPRVEHVLAIQLIGPFSVCERSRPEGVGVDARRTSDIGRHARAPSGSLSDLQYQLPIGVRQAIRGGTDGAPALLSGRVTEGGSSHGRQWLPEHLIFTIFFYSE